MRGASGIVLALLASVLGPGMAAAAPTPDKGTIVTLQDENDLAVGTDRNYTNGTRLGITLPTGEMPDVVGTAGRWLWGDGLQRLSFDLSQSMFTPRVTQAVRPNPSDRPYAAILLGTAALIHDTADRRDILSVGIGAIGPPALGEQAQNAVHRIVRAKTVKGWDYQLPGQPVVQITADRVWRLPITQPGSLLEVDALPELTAGVGTWRIYAQSGLQLRVGQGLDADFGVERMRPGLSGGDAFNTERGVAWYLFAGVDAQAIAWDETLDGEPFAATRHVGRLPLVAEFQVGAVIMLSNRVRASFAQVWQTPEFRGQYGHMFSFSSAALSIKF